MKTKDRRLGVNYKCFDFFCRVVLNVLLKKEKLVCTGNLLFLHKKLPYNPSEKTKAGKMYVVLI